MENWQKEAWIAEHIMGWRKVEKTEGIYKVDPGISFLVDSPRNSKTVFVGEPYLVGKKWGVKYRVWRPFSNIRDAWMVAEKMTAELEQDEPPGTALRFHGMMRGLDLWTMPEAKAAEELCVVAIVAMRHNSETLEKFG